MRQTLVVLFFAVSIFTSAIAQNVSPGMTMHRIAAGKLDQTGWTIAHSTGGNFRVSLPCLFNDYSVVESDPQALGATIFAIGCIVPTRAKFAATLARYHGSVDTAQKQFKRTATESVWPGGTVTKIEFNNLSATDHHIYKDGRCGFQRVILSGTELIALIVEALSPACEELDADVEKFFQSLVIESQFDSTNKDHN